jgi:uncharacterized protein with HEPN domain
VSRDALYLQHVLDAIGAVERYAAVGYDEFMAESHWQDAVIRQLEIIGEAVKRISPETLLHRPDIPWRRIAGMRDVLIQLHGCRSRGCLASYTEGLAPAARGR